MIGLVKLVWKICETGELVDGAVAFSPAARAVYAVKRNGVWHEVKATASDEAVKP